MKIGAQQDLTRGSALVNLWQFSFPADLFPQAFAGQRDYSGK